MTRSALHLAQALGHAASDKRIEILRQVGRVGSISEAARLGGISYKAAWQALETLSNLAGQALVEKVVGGLGGGGAQLSPAGHRLLAAADQLAQARSAVLARLQGQADTALPASGLLGLGLRTSLRNQLPCTVRALQAQGQSLRVALALSDDTLLHARITLESAELLGLQPGQAVLALCKATAVTVARSRASLAPAPGCNLLRARVHRAAPGRRVGEISLQLSPELYLVGFARQRLAFKPGQPALACVDETALVIAAGA